MSLSPLILLSALLGMATLFSLLAMLLAQTRLHWLIQLLMLVASALPFALIGADDLLIVALVQGFAVLCFLWLYRSRSGVNKNNDSPKPASSVLPTIGLKELMLGVFVVCALIAVFAQTYENGPIYTESELPSAHPIRMFGIGLALAIWNLAFAIFLNRGLSGKAKFGFAIAMLGSLIWAGWNDSMVLNQVREIWHWANFSLLGTAPFLPNKLTGMSSLIPWAILLLASSLMSGFIAWRIKKLRPVTTNLQNRKSSLINKIGHAVLSFIAIGALGFMFSSVAFCYFTAYPKLAPISQVYHQGEANGFALLVESAKQFGKSPIFESFTPELPGTTLKTEIAAHKKQFDSINAALSQPNCTWINWKTGEIVQANPFAYHFDSLSELRSIARALSAKRLQLLHDKKFDEVLDDGVLCIRVAETMVRDPNFISSLTGTAIEGMAVGLVFSGVEEASNEQLKRVSDELDKIFLHAGSVDSEMKRMQMNELLFANRTGWKASLSARVMFPESINDNIREAIIRRNTYRILLRSEIALELFHRDNGRYPLDLKSLVPNYLAELPIDPFSDANLPLKYSVMPDGNEIRLYSICHDRIDNGGVYDENAFMSECDLDLDLMTGDPLEMAKREVQEELDRKREEQESEAMFEGF